MASRHQGSTPAGGQRGGAGEAVAALLILLGAAGAFVWFSLSKVMRAEVQFVLLAANRNALLASAGSIVALAVLIGLAARKKNRFLTSTVEEAHVAIRPEIAGRKRGLVYLPHLLGIVAGLGVYGFYFATGVTRWCFFGFLTRPSFAAVRGLLVLTTTVLPGLAITGFVVVFLNGTGLARRWRASLVDRPEEEGKAYDRELPDPGDYQARSSKPTFLLGARESKSSLRFEPGVKLPSWVFFDYPMIFGGLLVFGRKGSGKTALLLRMLEDAIRFLHGSERKRWEAEKPAICVIDQKGDIAEFVLKTAKRYGRAADVVRLGVDTVAKWNPFGALGPTSGALECRQVGFFMRCAMTAGGNASNDNAFWQDNADNLIFRSAHLLALAGEGVGFGSVYKLITSLNAQETYHKELVEKARVTLVARSALGQDVTDARQELDDTARYFEEEFTKLDAKVRTTVISVVSNFHQKFMTAKYARSFGCAPSDPGHFAGFSDLIAKGKIFVLDVRANEHGTVATALAMLVKLHYQAAVKTRDRNPADGMKRATMFVMDEAQACLTPSTANTEGDDKYLEMSRSFKAIDVFATQQYTSFTAAVGRDMAQRIVGSFNNLVVYRHNDPALTDYLQRLVGQHERDEKSVSVTESSSAAERNLFAVEGETERDKQVSRSVSVQRREKPVIDAAIFKGMSTFEALGFFDQPRGLAITHFYTKPYFVEPRTPHEAVIRQLEEAA